MPKAVHLQHSRVQGGCPHLPLHQRRQVLRGGGLVRRFGLREPLLVSGRRVQTLDATDDRARGDWPARRVTRSVPSRGEAPRSPGGVPWPATYGFWPAGRTRSF